MPVAILTLMSQSRAAGTVYAGLSWRGTFKEGHRDMTRQSGAGAVLFRAGLCRMAGGRVFRFLWLLMRAGTG
ncbi:MAG TPA: hypothetical protein DEO70_13020 [Bacteroidales bacterium]|nr:MAG: hypothetical protein A2X11_06250 [Bacteroidetes bacterium GWE2_42_24]OFY28198.1 MAG: hypothetical protein A2X09_15340 [Bacteroidetes bacterium GWF2_43_11]PKP18400.1 MAG: hypothetical protein CVU06_12210 [Bacteroidetes bacterium HGW-Bacteroidetes-22]HBZ67750.1 hypothetical protein [Bacteroidales bacterium]